MLTAEDLASLLRIPLRTAQRRLAAMRTEGDARHADPVGRGRPPLVVSREVLAQRLGVTVADLGG